MSAEQAFQSSEHPLTLEELVDNYQGAQPPPVVSSSTCGKFWSRRLSAIMPFIHVASVFMSILTINRVAGVPDICRTVSFFGYFYGITMFSFGINEISLWVPTILTYRIQCLNWLLALVAWVLQVVSVVASQRAEGPFVEKKYLDGEVILQNVTDSFRAIYIARLVMAVVIWLLVSLRLYDILLCLRCSNNRITTNKEVNRLELGQDVVPLQRLEKAYLR
ncbi:hypothetical protein CXQ85_000768 [Candidozyma haemuli]|uniref:Uncharacterized protein n=1 Tax=Candidozyma haemuli TaxID=45357 RepID=A0A2V1AUF9_9ASCO|nr:hypothetical protein CXQ85_000768 [[Candida] haemuloni]PVH21777.1 hypothetical protein CXQ85_000768 [[Candida] haemuloni]